jgi:TRAP-type C4-dicarboxylate transport system substrate-binding protein
MTNITRRTMIAGAAAGGATVLLPKMGAAADPRELKISHQFPGGTATEGDFRDRLCQKFAGTVEARTNGALKCTIYPGSSLMKTNAQFSAMRKGALDMSLVPLNYAGGEVAETNIGLIPGLVTNYSQGMAWKDKPVGKYLADVLADKGVLLVSWIWQAGGIASRGKPIVEPDDAKGLKVRGGSREMDLVLKQAGATVVTIPSNEIYADMQTGVLDAAMTSSTSLISFRLEEIAKGLGSGRNAAYWFMLEPLMISKSVFDSLPKDMQDVVMSTGTEMEAFGVENAKADDQEVGTVYRKAGAEVVELSPATVARWQAIARDTAWKDFAARSESCSKLIQLAEQAL